MMFTDCAENCTAHLRPKQIKQHLSACGVAAGAADLLARQHGGPWSRGRNTFAGIERDAILFPDGAVYVWVAGGWVVASTESFERVA